MLTKDFRSIEELVFCKLQQWDRGMIFLRTQVIIRLPLFGFTSSCEGEATDVGIARVKQETGEQV